MKIEWNKVTWYSKILAIVVFLSSFYVGTTLGMNYQYTFDHGLTTQPSLFGYHVSEQLYGVSTSSSGQTTYSVTHPSKESTSTAKLTIHCGGFIRNAPTCPQGFYCKLNTIADTGGTCVQN